MNVIPAKAGITRKVAFETVSSHRVVQLGSKNHNVKLFRLLVKNKNGIVYLIGAGPGDPKLITVKGLDALRKADTVLYDRLANPLLLNEARTDAELIFVGKESGCHHLSQDEIIHLLLEKVKEGKTIARLKGGDPLIFGRGSEEAAELAAEGIPFEIIPGITAASGGTTYAGIPLTHRNLVTQCIFVTAHENPGKESSQVDWDLLAKMHNSTIVIYMGVAMLPKISQTLIESGMSPDFPAAAIENATTLKQRTIVSTISQLPEMVVKEGFQPPMITVISPTIDLRKQINWFEEKPLFGKKIVITRAESQSAGFAQILVDSGAEPVIFPVITIEYSEPDNDAVQEFINSRFDWIFFTSENGVNYFMKMLEKYNLNNLLRNVKIAAVGSATAAALNRHFVRVDFIPDTFTSESLLSEFSQIFQIEVKRFLRIKGDFESDPLSVGLEKAGGYVLPLQVYNTVAAEKSEDEISSFLSENHDAITFTSPSTVNSFITILSKDKADNYLDKTICFSIGPVTSKALTEAGISGFIESASHDTSGIIEAMKEFFSIDN